MQAGGGEVGARGFSRTEGMIPGVAGVRPSQDLGVRESMRAGSVAQCLGFPLMRWC